MVGISNYRKTPTESEELAYQIIIMKKKTPPGKEIKDYIPLAASYVAKKIIEDTIHVPDFQILKTCLEVVFATHSERVRGETYRCWYDVSVKAKDIKCPSLVIDMKEFGHIFMYAGAYYTEELIEKVILSLSEILGTPTETRTSSEKSYHWKCRVA